ncbi:MAG TPA: alpha-2-macroglobulin family protein [Pyrinomonadaceae bacterium]|nr:Ig-like domain-containing protein [Chloracidobacterium sp.]MBL0239031.1 Ig-like domain-containing protein [Chloracidobacterium sp.]MBP9936101.1 Ig-like domain-containing protein [Pyrinomonadaceae bacterium]HQY67358.1 alpha-2-macroglobulin family protein [Pyrinomonadaceae bacterium]HRA39571.1 alpha-2-macroglobulin family protein [Pyrinomonadaceae bacterium]
MKKITTWVLLLAVYLGYIAPVSLVAYGQGIGKTMEQRMKDTPEGLKFRLSEGVEGAETREKQQLAATDPLSESDSNSLLKRIPEIKPAVDDKTDFAKRIGTLPAPKTGNKNPVKFPSDEQRGTPKLDTTGQTLEVVRFSPEGEIPLAPDLSVTFSQPMVAVTSQEEAAKYAPVELSPQVEGRWRWLGTKTLMFDTTKRFPMATKFTARVPAGTKSANGQTLAKDVSWTFTTPPPKAESMYPNGGITRRDALIYVSFDQAISPDAVLRSITVTGGGKKLPIRLATQEEISGDSTINYYSKQAQAGRWLAFRAVNSDGLTENALPGASAINVTIAKGTPSAEGPLTSIKDQSFSFQTYSALKFSNGYCGWRDNRNCSPFESWYMEFNNSIDAAKFTTEMVKIEPAIEGLKIYPSGNYVYIQGYKKGRTSYKVTIDGSISDVYGQSLGQPAVATIKVGSASQNLYAQGGYMTVLDPTSTPTFSIYSTNHGAVKVRLYDVQPADWQKFQEYVRHINYDDGKRPPIPGRLVSDEVVEIANKPDEMVETRVDITKGLSGGFGNVIVDIEPTVRKDKYDRVRIFTWLQATQIGLDAFVDNTELVGFATDLKTGKPLTGVDLAIFPLEKASGSAKVASVEPSVFQSAWDWMTGWGSSQADEIVSTDADGSSAKTETVAEAMGDRTGENGILRLQLPESGSIKGQNYLVATRGKDVAFLPENTDYYWQDTGSWYRKSAGDSLRWFVFDDRKLYKPKEEVSVKGYIRRITGGKFGDVEGLGDAANGINYSVKDPRNNEIAKGTANLNAFGAFDFKFSLPDNANLGYARIELSTNTSISGSSHSHQFQIQEFRRPEFEVSSKVETEAPHFVGGSALMSVEAKYYAGGGLANADANWTVTASPTSYTPPNRGDFTFGTWVPWWRGYEYGRTAGGTSQSFKGVTDASGKHLLKIDFESVKPPRPYTITAASSVMDVNRQTWSSSTSMLVHPASLYVGIKTPRTFVQRGEKIEIESIVSDIDGKLATGREAEIKAVLKDWSYDKGSWKEITVDEQTCTVKSAEAAQKCSFVAKQGGRYTITATVMDDRERFNESEMTVWVPGGKTPPKRNVEQEEVQIIPSKKDFAPGDVAELLVIAPFTPAEGVLTLRRDGLVKTERFTMKDSSTTLKIPLDEKYLPNITAQVDLVGAAVRTNDKGEVETKLAKRPAFASGTMNLAISTASRQLTVSAEPVDKTLAPGGETKVNVAVKDYRGEPVANSEVAIIVVDESVLALTRYTIADPMSIFYTTRGDGVNDYHLRKDVLLGNPADVKADMPPPPPVPISSGVMSADGASARPSSAQKMKGGSREEKKPDLNFAAAEIDDDAADSETPINLRQNFNALALFSPTVKTDASGRAVVDIKLPDNLTRYRITAVSVDNGKRFGKTESTITAKQPLMVRPSAPRFMNFGDKIEMPVVVQNQTDKDMAVDVAVRATNAELTGGNGKRVVVKANDRVEVRFPVSAMKAGTARFQIVATSGKFNDAAEISLPVWTPATTEAFATYGTTDQNGAVIQPVQTPGDVYPQFGGLEVTTSSTQLQELTDAFLFLTNYPYACSEQISSRMISIAAMRDVLSAFKAKDMPTAKELEGYYARDIEILQSRQRSDGSFGLWKRDKERYEYPFLTVHVAHALALSKAKGYKVPDEMITKVKPYLKDVEKHYDQWYKNSPEVRWTISAYALYIRDMMGDKDIAKTKKLLAEATIEKMPFEALGWVLSVLANDPDSTVEVQAIIRHLMNRTTETAATANFVTNYGDGAWLIMYSNRRADGVLLEAMIKSDPKNDLVPKLVRGLLDHRTKGAWSNTQENVFILLALDKYFNTFEKVTPDFVTRIWLGNTYAGEDAFKGRSIDSNQLNIPMSYLTDQGGMSNLILDKQGAGRLFYRIGMKYAPKNLKLEPADYGFTVLRKYEAVDDKDDVKQNADGTWTIKAGARVRIRLTMVAQARRYHVALVDNLPAGLEILNPGLAVTESIPGDPGSDTPVVEFGSRSFGYGSWWYRQYWFEHQNFRDERAEAFTSLLWEGVYNYSYVARATTPGQFVVPPAKAEEMYHPETFGRTGTDFVHVE